MAIKERKQITGTEAQIKDYAGHNGVLAYATDTKHLHVLSGTAGTTTELANRTDIPDITGKADSSHTHAIADVTDLQEALNSASAQASIAIPKSGNRGVLAGYEEWTKEGATLTIDVSSGDSLLMETAGAAATINVQAGPVGQIATKIVWVALSKKSITINGVTGSFGEAIPTLTKSNAMLLFFLHDGSAECRLIGQWD